MPGNGVVRSAGRPCPPVVAGWNIRGARHATTLCGGEDWASSAFQPTAPSDPSPDRVKIVPRYILKEHIGPLVFALSALTSLLLLNYVAKRFGDLVGKGLPWSVIAEFFLLSIPFTVAMTLPMAVLVSTLHAFSRLASENEITAFKASGVSMQRLMRPVIMAAFGLTIFMVWFNDQVLPRANHRLAVLTTDISRVKPTLALSEQIINEVVRGQLYLRAGRISERTNQMRDVTIYDLSDATRRRTIVADSGTLAFSESGEDLVLTLFTGAMTELAPNEPQRLQRNFFEKNIVKVRGVATRLERDTTVEGYKSDRELTVCELQAKVEESRVSRDSLMQRLSRSSPEAVRAVRKSGGGPGLGRLYCNGVRAVFGVASAQAAELPQDTTSPPGASVTTIADSALPVADSTPAPKSAAQIASEALASPIMIEGMKTELQVANRSVGSYQVEIEKKFAIAAACVVFVLLGAPIALRFPRGGVGMTIGVSLGVFGLYYIGLIGGEALADRSILPPFWAMWSTNVALGVVGIYLTARLGHEGSTSRGSETGEWWDRLRQRLTRKRA